MENNKTIIKIYKCKKLEKDAQQEASSLEKILESVKSNQPPSLIIHIISNITIIVMH
jgi:hypothetical protein